MVLSPLLAYFVDAYALGKNIRDWRTGSKLPAIY
jgi:hypothetical protein